MYVSQTHVLIHNKYWPEFLVNLSNKTLILKQSAIYKVGIIVANFYTGLY